MYVLCMNSNIAAWYSRCELRDREEKRRRRL